jgi:hypothetical protein
MRLCWHSWQRLDRFGTCRCRKCGRESMLPPREMARELREWLTEDAMGLRAGNHERSADDH